MSNPSLASFHDCFGHVFLFAAGQNVFVRDLFWQEYLEYSPEVLGMECGQLGEVFLCHLPTSWTASQVCLPLSGMT